MCCAHMHKKDRRGVFQHHIKCETQSENNCCDNDGAEWYMQSNQLSYESKQKKERTKKKKTEKNNALKYEHFNERYD